MIDTGYHFYKVGTNRINRDCHLIEHIYNFKNKNGSIYSIQVDEYCHKIFFIKFFLRNQKTHPNKFSNILNTHDAFRVIRTSVNVLLHIREKQPDASFGFLGSPTIKGDKHEGINNTKRYRVYEYITTGYFGHLNYTHSVIPEKSCYILVSSHCEDREAYLENVSQMMKRLYPEFNN